MPRVSKDHIKTRPDRSSKYCQSCGKPNGQLFLVPLNKIDEIKVCKDCFDKYI